ncbi:Formin-binding protein 1 Formin-binding protein 17 [Larimichthys crocea]|uniref:Formin-binding protein 1 Formin-binding protein 17 n=1 Tax=Larimichthys crocea TaxID=215358 RepID=A0A6G0HE06_LARCR|nr:Formin-binding protein 1 Formin-binding protein 17 [Larimichthys crocea]
MMSSLTGNASLRAAALCDSSYPQSTAFTLTWYRAGDTVAFLKTVQEVVQAEDPKLRFLFVPNIIMLVAVDQFDNLEKHTSWGIDFLERYTKFLKERAEIELSYAKQIRSLSKKYHPKRSRDESRYTWCLAFAATLRQLSELSVQREELAENLNTQIVCELTRYTQELKTERKIHFQDGRRAQQHIESSWKQLESSKRRFERDCKEAERAQHVSDRIDLDNKTDGEKDQPSTTTHWYQLYTSGSRTWRSGGSSGSARRCVHRRRLKGKFPVVSRCLDAMMDAAEGIQPRMDTRQVVEVYKSGFEPPGDVEFEDYSATMRRSISESSYLDNRTEDGDIAGSCGRSSGKTRDALLKMREVYERSPQMGDADSLEPRLDEVKQSLQKLEEELRRNQAWLAEADSSPDGSYTEDHSAELHFKSRSSEFDDDFDDEEPLPSIGTCKSLYPFQGQNEGTLSMVEGELLSVVEEDKGDGWTRVRRNLEEEGYVPTSYIKVFLDSSAKGFVQSSRLV